MSNYLAIATVTATLQKMLQEEISREMPGIQVTTLRPDAVNSNISGACLNIYLYHATPNPAWRNADLRTRRPKADLIKHGQAGLDLHYLFTFYGEEQAYEPQRLMGATIRALVDNPMLTEDMIQESVEHSGVPALEGSTLMDQVQAVRLVPSTLTTEELSRIWSVFFQLPYSLSFPYQASAILIQGEKAGQAALPVLTRNTYITAARPVITQVESEAANALITLDSTIVVQGRQLAGKDTTQVQLGKTRLSPQVATDTEVKLTFSMLAREDILRLRAGSQGIQIVRLQVPEGVRSPQAANERTFDKAIESNVMPFVLCPKIQKKQGIHLQNIDLNDDDLYTGILTLSLDLQVDPKQRVFLLLNSISQSQTYIFRPTKRRQQTEQLSFPIAGIEAGDYFVRVQVDGAVSPLIQ